MKLFSMVRVAIDSECMKRLFFLLLFSGVFPFIIRGQQKETPLLERIISVRADAERLPTLLSRIGQANGFSFSYNSAIIDSNQTVSLDVTNQSMRSVLNGIFQGSMNYKEKNNYLILTKAPAPPIKNNTMIVIISGYVEDQQTGTKIPQASVYDKNSITSTVTDQYGYFRLKLDKKTDSISISISKKNYRDTLVSISAPGNQYVVISILPVTPDSVTLAARTGQPDSTELIKHEEFVLPYSSEPNIQNIRDTLYALAQVSILPFLGTNGQLSANVINDYSINFFGGYSLGTRQIELGFFFNLDRGDVRWLQLAGFGNLVGGKVYGVQAAGFINLNGSETEAVQVAGFANTNRGNTRGVQLAGFANTNIGEMEGVQVAGFSNLNGSETEAVQVAGFANTNRGNTRGAQLAGFANTNIGKMEGAQVAGFSNFTQGASHGVQVAGFSNVQLGNYTGSQFAGFTNIATAKISGSQVASFFNYANKVQGTQIGLINYADSLGGVPIGLFSIVRKGYHKIELSADEIFYVNLAFRTGVRKFHTMLMAGFKPPQSLNAMDTSVWTFGYGMGTTRKITKWWYLDLDISSQHVNKGSFTDALSLLNKAYVGFDFQVARKFSIATGVTLNGYLTRTTFTEYPELFTDYQPTQLSERNFNNSTNLKLWLGAKVALRFL